MPILTILLVLAIGILIIWLIQRFVQDPAKTILIIVMAVLIIIYLFRVFGLADVRI
jgi:hypothetical protein